jgi:multicomponent K+:H+ antiporter subunit A
LRRHHLFSLHERYAPKVSSPVAFERVYRDAGNGSGRVLQLVDTRSLQRYLALLIAFVVLLGTWAWMSPTGGPLGGSLPSTPPDPAGVAALSALVVGAIGTVVYRQRRMIAIVFLSVVGLVVSLAFIRFRAPDLALTQLSVEVVTIVLLLLALRFLPGEVATQSSRWRKLRDAGLAILGGLGVAALTYAMLTRPLQTISGFHLANSYSGGGGTNAVNVILVDFRGFDTLGEIAVLAMAALGLHALVEGLRLKPFAGSADRAADRYPIMLAELMRPLLPLALAVSAYIFLRGHNSPGGGFVAGLIAAVAVMLQYLASGIDFATERLRMDYIRVLGAGLLIASATGLASWIFGRPFLTSTFGYVDLPGIEKIELASAMVFDLGVFLVVVASVLLALSELGTLSRREIAAKPDKLEEI